jgi:hypothetical protein
MKYIICTSRDWADEFDYPIFSIFGEETRRIILLHNNYIDEEALEEVYFGSNEHFSFNRKEIIDMIQNAKEISVADINVLDKYTSGLAAFDIIDHILENMYSAAIDSNNSDLKHRLSELKQMD